MKSFYGPYARTSVLDKWHWKEKCPQYPKGLRIESMISSIIPDTIEMCDHCAKLDNVNISFGLAESNRKISKINHLTDRQINNNILIRKEIIKEQESKNSFNNINNQA